jgi:hypothetical protein
MPDTNCACRTAPQMYTLVHFLGTAPTKVPCTVQNAAQHQLVLYPMQHNTSLQITAGLFSRLTCCLNVGRNLLSRLSSQQRIQLRHCSSNWMRLCQLRRITSSVGHRCNIEQPAYTMQGNVKLAACATVLSFHPFHTVHKKVSRRFLWCFPKGIVSAS